MKAPEGCFLPTSLRIGIPAVDAQHEGLFARLVAIKESCLGGHCLLAADADALLVDLKEHFATEARVAAEFGLDFSTHASQHLEMERAVGRALNEALEGRADVFGALRYVEYWFERHIANEDMKLGECTALAGRAQAAPGWPAG